MAFHLLTYSGITAKTKAMGAKLMKPDAYQQLQNCGTVGEALIFLKQCPSYKELFADLDESSCHRDTIESLLTYSLYQDFTKLYRFADKHQRLFLGFYFKHYEILILKRCLRSAFSGSAVTVPLSSFQDFFEKHSELDIVKLGACKNITELLQALRGTPYYELLTRLEQAGYRSLFDYENSLDLYYFSTIWKTKDKLFRKQELKIIRENYGNKIDLLNIQWILRSKKYYRMQASDMYSMIIPHYYKLRPDTITAMTEAPSYEDALEIVRRGYYGKQYCEELYDSHSIEVIYIQLLERIYKLAGQRNPYTVASMNSYLYFKEHEINRITTIIEGIRYGLSPAEIAEYALNK